MPWNYEDQDPNKKVLMALQYAFEKCKNMVDIVFHVDGVFPFYDIIAEHMIENHFEGIKCLGDVKPKDKAEMNHLRSLGPFTRNWWRLDEFPPIYGIPDFCDVKHGFVVNRQSASKILKARADRATKCFESSIEFKIIPG